MSTLARMPDDKERLRRARNAHAMMVASSDQMRAELDEFIGKFDLGQLISFALLFDSKREEHRGTAIEVALWIASIHMMSRVEGVAAMRIERKEDRDDTGRDEAGDA